MKIFCFIILLIVLSCNIPVDPEHSWNNARAGGLIVGISENPPFVVITNDSIFGTEITMIRNFAAEKHLDITFIQGSESSLIQKSENYQIHVMLAGFGKKSHWLKKTGATLPYNDAQVILIPKGENRLLQEIEYYILNNKKE